MKELIFASHNRNKVQEIQDLLANQFVIKSLSDLKIEDNIPENENTFEGNAKSKVDYLLRLGFENVFADDSGLEIEVLDFEPGVFSARYAGEHKNDEDNIELVLSKMSNQENRKASFKTAIVLFFNKQYHVFIGKIKGEISTLKKGNMGFGYDPIFIPNGYTKTFAEMSSEEKNKISHRSIAIQKMVSFLQNLDQ